MKTQYDILYTHIYRSRLVDLPVDDSRISPDMLVHSRPLQPKFFVVVGLAGSLPLHTERRMPKREGRTAILSSHYRFVS
jgi:hypothetical protein